MIRNCTFRHCRRNQGSLPRNGFLNIDSLVELHQLSLRLFDYVHNQSSEKYRNLIKKHYP